MAALVAIMFLLVGQSEGFSAHPIPTTTATPTTTTTRSIRSSSTVAFLKIGRDDASANKQRSFQHKWNHRGHMNSTEEVFHQDTLEASSVEVDSNDANPKPKRKGYQRAEDWDAEQKAGGMTWEQKVQFDGLRMGNGFRQNEILSRHLSSF
ncbi:expressed unknown protein [Seminavis robusta]|uniref:Uncharacterized protein n=1 Tax=Seminavis robusta TaxID=568900 RepID=A0A9N8HST7_9STRA|nr:expressed unknown protein [Seminavis robusta]|eukprot:Sro1200_g251800.1 n/a (151) ;mRNA; f:1338-1790